LVTGGGVLTNGTRRALSAFNGESTKVMSEAQLGEKALVKSVVFASGVTAIGEETLACFGPRVSGVPVGCTMFGMGSFHSCTTLRPASLPVGCEATDEHAFMDCGAVTPPGCISIGRGAFSSCLLLASVTLPGPLQSIGRMGLRGLHLDGDHRDPGGLPTRLEHPMGMHATGHNVLSRR
jgi:hypothetical protein